jgi:hypothetical protein
MIFDFSPIWKPFFSHRIVSQGYRCTVTSFTTDTVPRGPTVSMDPMWPTHGIRGPNSWCVFTFRVSRNVLLNDIVSTMQKIHLLWKTMCQKSVHVSKIRTTWSVGCLCLRQSCSTTSIVSETRRVCHLPPSIVPHQCNVLTVHVRCDMNNIVSGHVHVYCCPFPTLTNEIFYL